MIAHFIFFVCYIAIVLIFTPVPTEIGKHKIRDKAEIFIRDEEKNDNRRENIA